MFTMFDPAASIELKKAFGAALARHPHNPYDAAREVIPDVGKANWIVNYWLDDPIVTAALGERLALGPVSGLPTKEEFALAVYQEKLDDAETKLKYLRFFAEIMGFVERGGGVGVNINNNIVNQPKIMKVPHFRNDEEWELAATNHHKALVNEH